MDLFHGWCQVHKIRRKCVSLGCRPTWLACHSHTQSCVQEEKGMGLVAPSMPETCTRISHLGVTPREPKNVNPRGKAWIRSCFGTIEKLRLKIIDSLSVLRTTGYVGNQRCMIQSLLATTQSGSKEGRSPNNKNQRMKKVVDSKLKIEELLLFPDKRKSFVADLTRRWRNLKIWRTKAIKSPLRIATCISRVKMFF